MTVTVIDHPLARHHLSRLRAVETRPEEFRRLIRRLSVLLAFEAMRDLRMDAIEVRTPLAKCDGVTLAERIGLVPILRAGLGMVDPLLELLPQAEVWHLGLYRDEATARPVHYYSKLPPRGPVDVALVVDPMLATGGSAVAALETLREWGVARLKLLSIIASRDGIDAVQQRIPEAQIYVGTVDAELDDRKFIVPGLGDAGDRIFNTFPPSDDDSK